MSSAIPRGVLSERLHELMEGRRLRAGVFLTFTFDPGFFEEDVLPLFLLESASHIPLVRSLQVEDALANLGPLLCVYYDRAGLRPKRGSGRLGVQYVAVSAGRGYVFHPKNLMLLVEDAQPDDDGHRATSLIAVAASANLTEDAWWENVECAHIEQIDDGAMCSYRDALLTLIARVRRCSPAGTTHEALDAVHGFVSRLTQRLKRSANGVLYPQLYVGGKSITQFLAETAGAELNGLCLEVLSPFLPKDGLGPLQDLQEAFEPRAVRLMLPRDGDQSGSAQCSETLYEAVRNLDNATWGRLPQEILRRGRSEATTPRAVHAKVYRFFHPSRRIEYLFVGSVNLTDAAHDGGRNMETGYLVQLEPGSVPDWWLTVDRSRPTAFQVAAEPGQEGKVYVPLDLLLDWRERAARCFWAGTLPSPELSLTAGGVALGVLTSLQPLRWQPLEPRMAAELAKRLEPGSYVHLEANEFEPTDILVQEIGRASRPSQLMTVDVAQVLRYWALLDDDHRAAFIEYRAAELDPEVAHQIGLAGDAPLRDEGSMFTTFAGIFQAFNRLGKAVDAAILEKRHAAAEYRLFGERFDSLQHLVQQLQGDDSRDVVQRYLIVLCAKQFVDELSRSHAQWVGEQAPRITALRRDIDSGIAVREALDLGGDPQERDRFLAWFEEWFLVRTKDAPA